MNTIFKGFDKLTYNRSAFEAMNLITDAMLFPLLMTAHPDYAIINPYHRLKDSEEKQALLSLLKAIGEHSEGYNDALGDLYMEHLANARTGQYFTSMDIAHLLAGIIQPGSDAKTLNDPACGSGRTLLAGARMNRNLVFYGNDIDHLCVKMTACNMLLNNLKAYISCGDTLTNKYTHVYHIYGMPGTGIPLLDILKYEPKPDITPDSGTFSSAFSEPISVQQSGDKITYIQGTLF